jgi:Bifunctional DNA primase/polymerase, N-terminal
MKGRVSRTGRSKVERGQTAFFMQYADDIVAHGYNVVAVLPGTKKPRYRRWQGACYKNTDLDWLPKHSHRCPNDSVGIACGSRVIAIDIDAEDAALADKLHQIARETLGDTPLVRFGSTPKRVLLYRPLDNIQTLRAGKFEVISYGGQVLAFGIHPKTDQPYSWVGGDPSNTLLEELPQVGAADTVCATCERSSRTGCPHLSRTNTIKPALAPACASAESLLAGYSSRAD